ncbi:hypothetical protein [Paenibacillus qinlingensis]|uniref:Uncharacterized protein n=1 Tax=Paenibacillus qinlingensis TaxID=1837343 RepID=A0ABU1P739_9BACL|nr:hypothetical protein [Paenibacillus qinlingensis]MDR6555503.1 hypothetical protein [Paenibacillus qinlingensis]
MRKMLVFGLGTFAAALAISVTAVDEAKAEPLQVTTWYSRMNLTEQA